MEMLFASICERAPIRKVTVVEKDRVVELGSGPLDGLTVRLSRSPQDMSIELHHMLGSALTVEHEREGRVLLDLHLSTTDVYDQKRGHLYRQALCFRQQDVFEMLRWKMTPLIHEAVYMAEQLPGQFIWEDELDKVYVGDAQLFAPQQPK